MTAVDERIKQAMADVEHGLGAGAPGRVLAEAYSAAVEGVVVALVGDVARAEGFAVVAQGGLARRDLVPFSDIDLVFVPDDARRRATTDAIEGAVRTLWDHGLALGHAVRAPDDLVVAAREDGHAATALLEARAIVDHDGRGTAAIRDAHAQAIARHRRALVRDKLEELLARRERFGASTHLVQPNLKSSPGALRDLHSTLWIGLLLAPWRADDVGRGTDAWRHLLAVGQLHEREGDALRAAADELLRARAALHLAVGRAEDRLLFEHQERLAQRLGVNGRGDATATETLMQVVLRLLQRTRTTVDGILERMLDDEPELIGPLLAAHGARADAGRRRSPRPLGAGFVERRGRLACDDPAIFESHPGALVDAFRLAAEERLAVSPTLRARIEGEVERRGPRGLVDDPETAEAILRLCRSTRVVGEPFTDMLDVGATALVLDDLARLDGRFRQDGYHAYTTDAHICRCADLALRAASGAAKAPPPLAPSLARTSRHHLFVLGALLHDIGKGLPDDHSEVGAVIAKREGERMGLPPGEVAILEMLVRHHLLLSKVSQRRDISDPAVVREVAEIVKTVERLDLLALVTWVDIESVAPGMFNDWKGRLLGMTVERVASFLKDPQGGAFLRGDIEADAVARARADLRGVMPDHVVERFVEGASVRTLAGRFSDELRRDLEAFARFEQAGATPVVSTRLSEGEHAHTVRVVCTARARLLADLAGALSSAGANILHAHADRRLDGVGLAVFRVDDGAGAALDATAVGHLEAMVRLAAAGRPPRRGASRRRRRAPYIVPTVRVVENSDSWGALAVHVTAEDRPGLVADLASTFADHGFDVVLAKITTEGERARDTFFVLPGRVEPERVAALDAALSAVIDAEASAS